MAAPQDAPALNSEHQVQLRSGHQYLRSALLTSNGTEFRREFSDVTLAYDDGQVQSYKGLLALLSPWLEQLLLAAGGHCDMVILPGTDSQSSPFQMVIQKLVFEKDPIGDSKNEVKQEDPKDNVRNNKFVLPFLEDSPEDEVKDIVCTPSILEGSIQKHVLDFAGQSVQQFKCNGSNKCMRTFKIERNFINHKAKMHPQVKSHNCVPCMKEFSNTTTMNNHFKKLHKGLNDSDLTCTACDMLFATINKLRSHNRHKHEAGTCWKCGKVFMSGDKLRLHRKCCYRTVKKETTC